MQADLDRKNNLSQFDDRQYETYKDKLESLNATRSQRRLSARGPQFEASQYQEPSDIETAVFASDQYHFNMHRRLQEADENAGANGANGTSSSASSEDVPPDVAIPPAAQAALGTTPANDAEDAAMDSDEATYTSTTTKATNALTDDISAVEEMEVTTVERPEKPSAQPIVVCIVVLMVILMIYYAVLYIDPNLDRKRRILKIALAPIIVALIYFTFKYISLTAQQQMIASPAGESVVLACSEGKRQVGGACAARLTWNQVQQLGCSISCTGSAVRRMSTLFSSSSGAGLAFVAVVSSVLALPLQQTQGLAWQG